MDWSVPPHTPEQVNITVSEKTDVFTRAHGLRPYYDVGQPVTFHVDAMEVVGRRKQPLRNASVSVVLQKPEEAMVRMVQAQASNWTMYKDVVVDVTRDIDLADNGGNGDLAAMDGVFTGTFAETDRNGPYVYTVKVTGSKQDGTPVEREIVGSFQVGPILQNKVTTGQIVNFHERTVPKDFSLDELLSDDNILDPLEQIENMEGDALDSLNDLLQ